MHSRRFACLLLGMWLAGGLLITGLVNENSRTVDRLLLQADPAATLRIKVLGPSETTLLLRYEAAELTRHELALWETADIGMAAFFLFFLLFGTGEGKFALALALALLLAAVAQRFIVLPEMVSLGKVTDFLPVAAGQGYRARLLMVEGAYFGVALGQWVVIVILAAFLIGRGRGRRRSDSSWNKFNVVNKANDSHIDR